MTPLRLFSSFTYVRPVLGLQGTANKSHDFIQLFKQAGLSKKYCGPHALATHLDLSLQKTIDLVRKFDLDKVNKEGTSAGQLFDVLDDFSSGAACRSPTASLIQDLIRGKKSFLATIPSTQNPKISHWVTVVGISRDACQYLDYGQFKSISKEDFFKNSPKIIFNE